MLKGTVVKDHRRVSWEGWGGGYGATSAMWHSAIHDGVPARPAHWRARKCKGIVLVQCTSLPRHPHCISVPNVCSGPHTHPVPLSLHLALVVPSMFNAKLLLVQPLVPRRRITPNMSSSAFKVPTLAHQSCFFWRRSSSPKKIPTSPCAHPRAPVSLHLALVVLQLAPECLVKGVGIGRGDAFLGRPKVRRPLDVRALATGRLVLLVPAGALPCGRERGARRQVKLHATDAACAACAARLDNGATPRDDCAGQWRVATARPRARCTRATRAAAAARARATAAGVWLLRCV